MPAKAGIQTYQTATKTLDPGFHRGDDFEFYGVTTLDSPWGHLFFRRGDTFYEGLIFDQAMNSAGTSLRRITS